MYMNCTLTVIPSPNKAGYSDCFSGCKTRSQKKRHRAEAHGTVFSMCIIPQAAGTP